MKIMLVFKKAKEMRERSPLCPRNGKRAEVVLGAIKPTTKKNQADAINGGLGEAWRCCEVRQLLCSTGRITGRLSLRSLPYGIKEAFSNS